MRGRDRLKVLAGVVLAGVLGAPAATAAAAGGPRAGAAAESHYNVGAAHSPQLLRRLAGPPGAAGQHGRTGSPATRPRGSVQGVDVAAFQHGRGVPINWPKVAAARIQFAAIKATEGNYYVNPYHSRDLARATAAGVHVIAYAFANPRQGAGNGTAAGQARFLVRHTPILNGRRPPLMLDIEYNPYRGGVCYGLHGAAMVGWLKRFDGEIRKLTGRLPIIYTTADWWRRCTGGSRAFGTSLIWPAAWTTAARPAMPRGWRNWALWQYTSRGTVPGIPARGTTDLDALNLIAPGRQKAAVGGGVSVPVSHVVRRAVTGLAYAASRLPAGLTVHASGMVSGTPTAPGSARSSTVTAGSQGRTLGSIGVTWDVSQASS